LGHFGAITHFFLIGNAFIGHRGGSLRIKGKNFPSHTRKDFGLFSLSLKCYYSSVLPFLVVVVVDATVRIDGVLVRAKSLILDNRITSETD
jgi:hypothetical protein